MSAKDADRHAKGLAKRDHAALFYDKVDHKDDIVAAYIRYFASRRDKVMYVVPSEEEERTRRALGKRGIDVASLYKRGILQLIPTEHDPRSIAGLPFDSKSNAWKNWLSSCCEKEPGRLIRLVVDNPLSIFPPDDILRMEAEVGEGIGLPATALCVHHIPSAIAISNTFYKDLVGLHRYALFPGYAAEINSSPGG